MLHSEFFYVYKRCKNLVKFFLDGYYIENCSSYSLCAQTRRSQKDNDILEMHAMYSLCVQTEVAKVYKALFPIRLLFVKVWRFKFFNEVELIFTSAADPWLVSLLDQA